MKLKNVLILVAMDAELSYCLETFSFEKKKMTILNLDVSVYTSENKNIYLAKTGIGPINAGAVTALLLNEVKFDSVLLLGLGGAIDPRLAVGDICIGTHVIQHDAICSYDDRIEQMASGELHLSLEPRDRASIKTLTDNVFNESVGTYLKNKGFNVFTGSILSGAEFNASKVRKESMKEKFKDGILVEMEACGVALICKRLGVSFSVIKTVADTLSVSPDKEYKDYVASSAKKCADIFDFVRGEIESPED